MIINIELLEKLIELEGLNGVAKLSIKAGVHHSTIVKMRLGFAPKKLSTRKKIADSWDIAMSDLFTSHGSSNPAATG